MSMRPAAALLLLAALANCGTPERNTPGPLVVLIGDSTTAGYGGARGYVVADTAPLAALTALLPDDSHWRHAVVVNLGVPNSTSADWAVATAPCPSAPPLAPDAPAWVRLGARACATGAPYVDQVAPLVGRPIDVALVTLGTNDPYRDAATTPETTVAHLRTIAERLAPARVLIASPHWTSHPARAGFVDALATELRARG